MKNFTALSNADNQEMLKDYNKYSYRKSNTISSDDEKKLYKNISIN